MHRSAALLALAMPTLFLSACEIETRTARPGTGAVRADEARVPAPASTWVRHVDLEAFDDSIEIDVVLELDRDEQFELTVEATEHGGVDRESVRGRYRWSAGTLVLSGDDGEVHRFRLRDDELVLDLDWRLDAIRAVARLPEISLVRSG